MNSWIGFFFQIGGLDPSRVIFLNDWHISLSVGHVDLRYLTIEFKSIIDVHLKLS